MASKREHSEWKPAPELHGGRVVRPPSPPDMNSEWRTAVLGVYGIDAEVDALPQLTFPSTEASPPGIIVMSDDDAMPAIIARESDTDADTDARWDEMIIAASARDTRCVLPNARECSRNLLEDSGFRVDDTFITARRSSSPTRPPWFDALANDSVSSVSGQAARVSADAFWPESKDLEQAEFAPVPPSNVNLLFSPVTPFQSREQLLCELERLVTHLECQVRSISDALDSCQSHSSTELYVRLASMVNAALVKLVLTDGRGEPVE